MSGHCNLSTELSVERLAALSPAKRALFERLQGGPVDDTQATQTQIARRKVEEPAPLSFAQERLWFLDQLEPNNPFYNVPIATRIQGDLDGELLEAALRSVIVRHDALRTLFRAVDGQPQQVVSPDCDFRLARIDLSVCTPEARQQQLDQITVAEALAPFCLERGPLVRGTLIRLAADEHVLLLTLHHIICDGWSMAVLRDEVAAFYAAAILKQPAQLRPLPLQYADFAAWQRGPGHGLAGERHLRYWREQLADRPGPLALPLDHPRPAMQTYGGGVRRCRVGGCLLHALRGLAAEENATLCMVLMAAFQVLLARLCQERDVCVGTPIANRSRPELERLIGFFANTLVIRGRLEENPSFRTFVAQLRATMLSAYAHQDLPFSQLVEDLQPTRDLSRTPLAQVMFVLQNIPVRSRQIAGLTITDTTFDHAPLSNFDLTLNVDEHADRLDLSLVYNTDLFDSATIERMLGAYETLLGEAVADSDVCVFDLPILTARNRHMLLEVWNDTEVPFSHDRCIHELFAEQARRSPNAVAVLCEGSQLTYGELDRLSNRLARYLIDQGAQVDTCVGVCLERSPALITTLLGILKSGAAFLPIDPHYPESRRAAMIDDARVSLLVTDSETAATLPPGPYRTILLDVDAPRITAASDAPQSETTAGPLNVAYVIYTSGSTGQAKGVEVEHRGLVNHAQALVEQYGLTTGDRLLQYLSLSFDAAAEEIFPTLASGATLCLHPAPAELSGRVLLDWSREQGVNILHLPVPVWSSLVDELAISGRAPARHLKTVLAGGDILPAEQLRRWRTAVGTSIRFLFAYGVTEATITSTIFDGTGEMPATSTSVLPIGRAIANTRLYVLDEFRQPVPVGVAGELYIGGAGVARGYLRRAELTAERFLADPFATRRGARMYRSGDLVRYLPDGNLEFLGRIDRQVKVRGHRIEPAEIEAALQLHEQVREAIVVAHGAGESKRLAAYVGCAAGSALSDQDLRAFLAARLPAPMLPAAIIVMDRLPRLTCAKVDVSALPTPNWQRTEGQAVFLEPRDRIESTLAQIWQEILGLECVGVHDNFFELGGDSIRSIQVIARAGAAGLQITPKQFFQNQTIAQLACVAVSAPAKCAPQGPVVGPAALLPIQHEFFALASDDYSFNNQAIMLSVKGSVRSESIDRAVRMLLVHHDALRARFTRSAEGAWQQDIAPPEDRPVLSRVDLAGTPDDDVFQEIESIAARAQRTLDLERGPVVQCVYFDLGPQRPARLLLVIHHLVVDAVSWRILLFDLNSLCQQIEADTDPVLAPKTTSLAEWSRRLVELADSEEMRKVLPSWLSDAQPCVQIPREPSGEDNVYATLATVARQLDVETTRQLLSEAPNAYRARPHELLVTALAGTIARFVGKDAVRLNLEGHGREVLFDDVDLSRTVGWFTSLYPITLRLPAHARVGERVRAVKEQLRAVRNGGLDYGMLRWLPSDPVVRDRMATAPSSEVCFNYLGQFDNALQGEALFAAAMESTGSSVSPCTARRHLWEIIVYVSDGQLHLEWHYSRALHRAETIEQLATDYLGELQVLVATSNSAEASALAPTDFPLADVDQADLEALKLLLGEG
ncbi:MAG TPA: amino acid adenylation domain-containing protein [Pirellulales bacterium]|jgi:amino acid adenylation domain-containing protein/non-ribosomal peptide synthase protein (TIGR01720 family)